MADDRAESDTRSDGQETAEGGRIGRLDRVCSTVSRVDLRSLAAFRIAIAAIVLWDLALRARDLEAHYTDDGVLPRTALIENFLNRLSYPCLHLIGGTAATQIALFLLCGACATGMLLGWRTRLCTFGVWLLNISLQARNPLIVHGGDNLLRVMLFWALFTPLGARWSVDRHRASRIEAEAGSISSWGSAGLLLQLCCMYFFAALLKSGPAWWREGTAVYLALSLDQFSTPYGRALLPLHDLLRIITFLTLVMEAVGPLMALYSCRAPRLRIFLFGSFMLFHIGLGLCLELGIFPAVCIASWLLFLPALFWDSAEKRLRMAESRLKTAPADRIARFIRGLGGHAATRPLCIRPAPLQEAAACFFLVYVLWSNIQACDPVRWRGVYPHRLTVIGELVHLDQYWNLFAPYPSLEHGWYVVIGTLRNGSTVALPLGGDVTWLRPGSVSGTYRNERWRKYLMNIALPENGGHRYFYAQYLRRKWDDAEPANRKLARIDIYFVSRRALPDYRESAEERTLLWTHDCLP